MSVRHAVKPYGAGEAGGDSEGDGVGVSVIGVGASVGVATGVSVGVGAAVRLDAGLAVGASDGDGVGSGGTGTGVVSAMGTETSGCAVATSVGSGARGATDDRAFGRGWIDTLIEAIGVPVAPRTAPTASGLGLATVPDAGTRSTDCTSAKTVATPRTTAASTRAYGRT